MKELAYQKVYKQIKQAIFEGQYAPGTLLPIEQELEEIYQVSRTTVRKAVALLVQEELVEVRQGRGTMVRSIKAPQNYNHVTSVTESLRKAGYTVDTRQRQIDCITAPVELQEALRLNPQQKIIRVQRVQTADGIPVCVMVNYIPENLVKGMDVEQPEFIGLYEFLEKRYGLVANSTDDVISAEAADFTTALILEKNPGFPLLHVNRICYDANGRPICVDDVKVLGDRYEARMSTYIREK